MNNKLKIIIILFFNFLYVSGQISIKGEIVDTKGEAYSGVSVVIMSLPDSIITNYTFTDENGRYSFNYQGDSQNLLVSIKSISIKAKQKRIARQDTTVNFIAEQSAIMLREVSIRADKIWGQKDTVNYLVSSFSSKTDIVIGDVLKKMPGISVSENGAINYQGKPINKFYVENLDLLGGRYNIATNNISVKDISTVQVLENHQPVKALEDIDISTNAAINLKLKDDAKGTLGIIATLGAGASPFLWENELSTTYFSRNKQNISTYKGNNTGVDLSKEQQSFTNRNLFEQNNILGVVIPSPPSIKLNRYLYNSSNSITVNNLFKMGKEETLNFNILYLNDHERRDSNSESSYFMGNDSVLIVEEDMHSANNTNKIEGELRYNKNSQKEYFNNNLNIQGLWTNRLGLVSNPDHIQQRMKIPTFSASNMLHWIRKKDNGKGFEISSSMGFKSTPQTLSMTPGLYEEMLNNGEVYKMLKQVATHTHLYANNKFGLLSSWNIGNVVVTPSININFAQKKLESNMYKTSNNGTEIALEADSLQNRLEQISVEISPSFNFRYNLRKVKILVNVPLSYNIIHINNRLEKEDHNTKKLFIQPYVNVNYELNSEFSVDGQYSFYNSLGDISKLYTGYILENYRTMNVYDNHLPQTRGNNANIRTTFKNIFQMLFISANINYSYSKRDFLYAQQFDNILSTTTAVKIDNSSDNISVRADISKGFDFVNTTVTLAGRYGISTSEQLRQSQLIDYKNRAVNINGTLNMNPFYWLTLNYESIWNKSWGKIKNEDSFDPIITFRNIVSGEFHLPKNISLKVGYEHYHNSAAMGNKNLSFTDIDLKYTWKKVNLSLAWNNIFNKDTYISAYYNGINAYYHSYKIRGSNVLLKVRLKLK